ncbi:MAG TPA: hypothetical protein VGM19_05035 [Armatimonadota bacterium]|jgi:hypothetical protein
MSKLLLLGAALLLVLVMVGCGAGGSPTGLENTAPAITAAGVAPAVVPPIVDGRLFGQWVTIMAKLNGAETSVKAVMGWDKSYDYVLMKFNANGTASRDAYLTGSLDSTAPGSWTAASGSGTMAWNGNPPAPFTYATSGKTLVLTFTGGGNTRQITCAKVGALTERDPKMAGVWRLTGTSLDGVNAPPSSLYKSGATAFVMNLRANGGGSQMLLKQRQVIPAETQAVTWITGGGVFSRGVGNQKLGLYLAQGGSLILWVREQGQTRKLIFKPYGAVGDHSASFLGSWKLAGVKADGTNFSAATYFHWEVGTTHMTTEFLPGGTMIATDLSATNAITGQSVNGWYTSGSTLHLLTDNADAPDQSFATNFTGTAVKLTESHLGHTYVLTFNPVL